MRKNILWIFLVLIFSCSGSYKFIADKKITKSPHVYFQPKAVSHFIRGCIHDFQGDYKSALLEFSEALLFDSTSATIYNKIAEQYVKLKKYESAEKILKSNNKTS